MINQNWLLISYVNGIKQYKESFITLDEVLTRLCDILKNLRILDFIDKGYYVSTVFLDVVYTKRYVVECEVPNIKYMIVKKKTGNINKILFENKIKKYKKEYYEKD